MVLLTISFKIDDEITVESLLKCKKWPRIFKNVF